MRQQACCAEVVALKGAQSFAVSPGLKLQAITSPTNETSSTACAASDWLPNETTACAAAGWLPNCALIAMQQQEQWEQEQQPEQP